MPEWLIALAWQVGGTGAVMALGALWALHRGMWFPAWAVEIYRQRITEQTTTYQTRIAELTAELEREREDHRRDNETNERKLLNALGVADKVTAMVSQAASSAASRRRSA